MRTPTLLLSLTFAAALAAPAAAQEEPLPIAPSPAPAPAPAPAPGPAPASTSPPGPPAPAPATGLPPGEILQPVSQYWMPIESGALDSHLDLQFVYTSYSLGSGRTSASYHGLSLSIEGQYAFADVFEVGLNVPILQRAWGLFGSSSVSGSFFGNLELGLKAKVAGQSKGAWAISVFVDTYFPTLAFYDPPPNVTIKRDYAGLQIGGAAAGAVSIVSFGGGLGTYWGINNGGQDLVILGFDLHTAVRPLSFLAPYLAFQIGAPLSPDGLDLAFAISVGLRFLPIRALHLDLGTRIAVTEGGRLYTPGGRANLTFAFGWTI